MPSDPRNDLASLVQRAVHGVQEWEAGFGPAATHESLAVEPAALIGALDELVQRLHDNYPFFHPRYAGQMLKPPHPAAIAGYLAAMQINPNAHALDGGPATAQLEKEVVGQLAEMFGFPEHLGHLTSSGTIANLEALYIARESHPGLGIAYSSEAHYTHGRMCGVLGLPGTAIAAGVDGRMDVDALREALSDGGIGTVVATAGTTGLGAVDQVQDIVAVARQHGARVHVDAAYGGFFTLLARRDEPAVAPGPWLAISQADSVVVDPHKHGLQPYGCGAVLFRDPSVGRFYVHDSPYTYFTSDELHLGEISLECSRAGAAAAALWTTLRLIPLEPDTGLGAVLGACRRAALRWDQELAGSGALRTYRPAELDIASYFDATAETTSEIDASSARVLAAGMASADPVFVSTLTVPAARFTQLHPSVRADSESVRVLRSVLMKPEHEASVPWLIERISSLTAGGLSLTLRFMHGSWRRASSFAVPAW
jgi:glutamate/tyrosine decarboxylase-like PLP-dependent enzyme